MVAEKTLVTTVISDTKISIGFNTEIEMLIPECLTFLKLSDLSCTFCGYQARQDSEQHCCWCHTTFMVDSKDEKRLAKFRAHEKKCSKNRNHKHIASLCSSSSSSSRSSHLSIVKCALGKMEIALHYLKALKEEDFVGGRGAWHEYLRRSISPEMVMECLLRIQGRLKDSWIDERKLSLGTDIELGSGYFDPEDTIPSNLCIAMKFGHSISGLETYRRMLACSIRCPYTSEASIVARKKRKNDQVNSSGSMNIVLEGRQI